MNNGKRKMLHKNSVDLYTDCFNNFTNPLTNNKGSLKSNSQSFDEDTIPTKRYIEQSKLINNTFQKDLSKDQINTTINLNITAIPYNMNNNSFLDNSLMANMGLVPANKMPNKILDDITPILEEPVVISLGEMINNEDNHPPEIVSPTPIKYDKQDVHENLTAFITPVKNQEKSENGYLDVNKLKQSFLKQNTTIDNGDIIKKMSLGKEKPKPQIKTFEKNNKIIDPKSNYSNDSVIPKFEFFSKYLLPSFIKQCDEMLLYQEECGVATIKNNVDRLCSVYQKTFARNLNIYDKCKTIISDQDTCS